MKINVLIKTLEKISAKYGNVDVMARDQSSDDYWSLEMVRFLVAEEGEFPEDWNMPAGYKFVLLSN